MSRAIVRLDTPLMRDTSLCPIDFDASSYRFKKIFFALWPEAVIDLLFLIEASVKLLLQFIRLFTDVSKGNRSDPSPPGDAAVRKVAIFEL